MSEKIPFARSQSLVHPEPTFLSAKSDVIVDLPSRPCIQRGAPKTIGNGFSLFLLELTIARLCLKERIPVLHTMYFSGSLSPMTKSKIVMVHPTDLLLWLQLHMQVSTWAVLVRRGHFNEVDNADCN